MKHVAIDQAQELVNARLRDLHKVNDWFENDKLSEENDRLVEENKELKERNSQLEKGKVRPFTMESFDPQVSLCDLEEKYILNALKHFKGDKAKAAHALGLTIKTLYNKLHAYGEL